MAKKKKFPEQCQAKHIMQGREYNESLLYYLKTNKYMNHLSTTWIEVHSSLRQEFANKHQLTIATLCASCTKRYCNSSD